MERCPAEILSAFFEHACYDGGATAASLRSVSRHFLNVAQPYRFQSISVSGSATLTSLVDALHHADETSLRGVRHLFISDLSRTELLGFEHQEEGGAEEKRRDTPSRKQARHTTGLVRTILTQLAPYVRTLTLFLTSSPCTARRLVRNTSFPHLTDLVLYAPSIGFGNLATISAPNLRGLSICQTDVLEPNSRMLLGVALERFTYQSPRLDLIVVESTKVMSRPDSTVWQDDFAWELINMRAREKPEFKPHYRMHLLRTGNEPLQPLSASLLEVHPTLTQGLGEDMGSQLQAYDTHKARWAAHDQTIVEIIPVQPTVSEPTHLNRIKTLIVACFIHLIHLLARWTSLLG